jgi:hypothetical protein
MTKKRFYNSNIRVMITISQCGLKVIGHRYA